jgi:hypothetical protein
VSYNPEIAVEVFWRPLMSVILPSGSRNSCRLRDGCRKDPARELIVIRVATDGATTKRTLRFPENPVALQVLLSCVPLMRPTCKGILQRFGRDALSYE